MPDDATATIAPPAAPPTTQPDATPAPYPALFNGDGTFKEGWVDSLGDEFAPFRDTLKAKNFKGLDGVLSAYANIERKMGAASNDEFVRIPGEKADPDTVARFRQQLGIPAAPEGYELKRPETLPAEAWSDDQAAQFMGLAHQLNLPKAAAAKLVEWYGGTLAQQAQAQAEAVKANTAAADMQLRKDWGDEYDHNMDLAARAVSHAGYDPKDPLFSHPEYVKLAHAFGKMVDESRLPVQKGDSVDFKGDPSAQMQAIQENKDHPYWSKAGDPGYNKLAHERAVELMSRLSVEIGRRKDRGG